MYSMPSKEDTSYTETILAWLSWATARDSSRNRRRNSAFSARSLFSVFTATRRFSRKSFPLYTLDMPPVPISSKS